MSRFHFCNREFLLKQLFLHVRELWSLCLLRNVSYWNTSDMSAFKTFRTDSPKCYCRNLVDQFCFWVKNVKNTVSVNWLCSSVQTPLPLKLRCLYSNNSMIVAILKSLDFLNQSCDSSNFWDEISLCLQQLNSEYHTVESKYFRFTIQLSCRSSWQPEELCKTYLDNTTLWVVIKRENQLFTLE